MPSPLQIWLIAGELACLLIYFHDSFEIGISAARGQKQITLQAKVVAMSFATALIMALWPFVFAIALAAVFSDKGQGK